MFMYFDRITNFKIDVIAKHNVLCKMLFKLVKNLVKLLEFYCEIRRQHFILGNYMTIGLRVLKIKFKKCLRNLMISKMNETVIHVR